MLESRSSGRLLKINETYDFSIAERDMTIAQTPRNGYAFMYNARAIWEEIGKNGSDICELMKEAHKPEEFSKKQLRMPDKSKTVEPKR